MAKFKFLSRQALEHHLNPLRKADLLRQNFDNGGVQTFSNQFKRLPKKTIIDITGGSVGCGRAITESCG
jgi:hypothetical protein